METGGGKDGGRYYVAAPSHPLSPPVALLMRSLVHWEGRSIDPAASLRPPWSSLPAWRARGLPSRGALPRVPFDGLCGPPQTHSPSDTPPCAPCAGGASPLGPGRSPTTWVGSHLL